jgi:hypothetical protein
MKSYRKFVQPYQDKARKAQCDTNQILLATYLDTL